MTGPARRYDTEQEAIAAAARVFTWPGRAGEFLGAWALASLTSWIVAAPLLLVLPEHWILGLPADAPGGAVAAVLAVNSGLCGLLFLGLLKLDAADKRRGRVR